MRTERLRVDLGDVTPPVIRVLDLPRDATLDEVHLLLQAGLGWMQRHVHLFQVGERFYGPPDEAEDGEEEDERGVRLRDLPDRWVYLYDLGDGWTHDVTRLGTGGDEPGLVYGEGACPPEDCGGPGGFEELWKAGEVDDFDPERTALLVRQVIGRVPPSVRLFLDTVGERMTLTVAGRLPRAAVRQIQDERPGWARIHGPAQREDDLPALAGLHEVLYAERVVQLQRGVLVPVKVASEPVRMLRRVREHYDPTTFTGLLATTTVALLVAHGPLGQAELVARFVATFGGRWQVDGRALTESDVDFALIDLRHELEGLDQIEVDGPTWRAGSEACWLLPHAALLAELWRREGWYHSRS